MSSRIKRVISMILCVAMLCGMCMTADARTYYTGNQVKWSNNKVRIVSIKGNKVTYRKVRYVNNGYFDEAVAGKKRTAKLTSKTKYYFGSPNRLFKLMEKSRYTKNHMTLKWIYRVKKSTFRKAINKSYWDQIQIKNGKVTRIFTKMQIAG